MVVNQKSRVAISRYTSPNVILNLVNCTSGIGFLGTMCVNANYSVSLQEDLSYEASRTATHEMGHS